MFEKKIEMMLQRPMELAFLAPLPLEAFEVCVSSCYPTSLSLR